MILDKTLCMYLYMITFIDCVPLKSKRIIDELVRTTQECSQEVRNSYSYNSPTAYSNVLFVVSCIKCGSVDPSSTTTLRSLSPRFGVNGSNQDVNGYLRHNMCWQTLQKNYMCVFEAFGKKKTLSVALSSIAWESQESFMSFEGMLGVD